MISIKKYLKLSVLIAFGAFLTSCEQDTNLSLEIQESVYLRFNTSADPILTTRAAGSVDDSVAESTSIKDLNVFIWNDLFSYHKYYTSVSVATMQIIAGNYHIVAIGNAGKDLGNADVSTLHTTTLAQLGIDTYNDAVMTYVGELSTTAGTNINRPVGTKSPRIAPCRRKSSKPCGRTFRTSADAAKTGYFTLTQKAERDLRSAFLHI